MVGPIPPRNVGCPTEGPAKRTGFERPTPLLQVPYLFAYACHRIAKPVDLLLGFRFDRFDHESAGNRKLMVAA
jgi:hypothetical protein